MINSSEKIKFLKVFKWFLTFATEYLLQWKIIHVGNSNFSYFPWTQLPIKYGAPLIRLLINFSSILFISWHIIVVFDQKVQRSSLNPWLKTRKKNKPWRCFIFKRLYGAWRRDTTILTYTHNNLMYYAPCCLQCFVLFLFVVFSSSVLDH